jgi:hypothetical protein
MNRVVSPHELSVLSSEYNYILQLTINQPKKPGTGSNLVINYNYILQLTINQPKKKKTRYRIRFSHKGPKLRYYDIPRTVIYSFA